MYTYIYSYTYIYIYVYIYIYICIYIYLYWCEIRGADLMPARRVETATLVATAVMTRPIHVYIHEIAMRTY